MRRRWNLTRCRVSLEGDFARVDKSPGETEGEAVVMVIDGWELLALAVAEGVECRIEGFRNDFRFLSNFWPSPLVVDGIVFATVEHAYQAAKVTDRAERERIAARASPGWAKREGRKLPLRKDWDSLRVQVMEELILLKFQTHADLREKLLAMGNCYLEETNNWGDRFWGVSKGAGENHLGRILMRVREQLKKQC